MFLWGSHRSHPLQQKKRAKKSRDASQSEIRSKYKTSHLVDLESSKVIIHPDGTWMPYTADGKLVLKGTSDLGDAIDMTFDEGKDGTRHKNMESSNRWRSDRSIFK